ncbi:hypothetical protein ACQ4PT_000219 [Festuca glaucescens]
MDGTDSNGNGVCFAYDLLLDILRRLPRRALAESRRVCRAWRAVVDGHNLLLPHSFPRGVFPGIFTNNFGCYNESSFFAPSAEGRPRGAPDGLAFRRPLFRHDWASVLHCCNGLLLLQDKNCYLYVCNPATVRCARLPQPPSENPWVWPYHNDRAMFLAFDPAVPRHYEVFLLSEGTIAPDVVEEKIQPRKKVKNIQPQTWIELDVEQLHLPILFEEEQLSEESQDEMRWPRNCPCRLEQAEVSPPEGQQEVHAYVPGPEEPNDKVVSILVFSSQTGQWTSREFVPGRCAPRHLYDIVTMPHPRRVKIWKTADYWRGSLYVHCWNNIIMIMRNFEGAYDMAQLPGKAYDDSEYRSIYLSPMRSILVSYDRGVRYVVLDMFQLHVWTLTESHDGHVGWMLTHEADLGPYNPKLQQCREPKVLWEAVDNNKATISLFEPRNNTIDDVDGDGDDEEEEEDIHEVDTCEGTSDVEDHDDDNGQSEEAELSGHEALESNTADDTGGDGDDEEGIHEVDTFEGKNIFEIYIDDNGHHEGEPYKDEDGEFKSKQGCLCYWDSDEDNFIDLDESDTSNEDNFIDLDESDTDLEDDEYGFYGIIGLHPHKDVVLLRTSGGVVAYHFRTSRMQYLGWQLVRNPHSHSHGINAAFPYRPCYVDVLPTTKLPCYANSLN